MTAKTLPRATPALVILPCLALTTDPDRASDDVEMTAVVETKSPTSMLLDIQNGDYRITVDADGVISSSPVEDQIGKTVLLQWQGKSDRKAMGPGDFYYELAKYARAEIQAGRTGPTDAQSLIEHPEFSPLGGVVSAAKRLETLGDPRLKDWLSDTYPALKGALHQEVR